MNKKLFIPIVLTAGIVISGCGGHKSKDISKDAFDTLSISKQDSAKPLRITYETTILSDSQKVIVERTIKDYFSFYGIIGDNAKIIITEDDTMTDKSTLAYAEPGVIHLVPKNITAHDEENMSNTMSHEIFHTLPPKKALAIPPYKLKDGSTIIGFHGLSIVVQKGEQKTQFNLIEEAAAEACATKFKPGYVRNYVSIYWPIYRMMGRGWFTTEDIIQAQRTNDLCFLISRMINRMPSNEEIEKIMNIFSNLSAITKDIPNQDIINEDNARQALDSIENMRK